MRDFINFKFMTRQNGYSIYRDVESSLIISRKERKKCVHTERQDEEHENKQIK